MKKNIKYYDILQFALLLISYMFINKVIYLAPNLSFSIGIIIYSFTFLFLVLSYQSNNLKYAKSIIYKSLLVFSLFYIIIILLNSISGIPESNLISDSLRQIFTPYTFSFKNIVLYLPSVTILLFMLVYFLTHYLFLATFEAINSNSNYLVAFILSIMISFILDQILYLPIANLVDLFNNSITYKDLIDMLTAHFIVVIFSSIIISMIYLIIKERSNKRT